MTCTLITRTGTWQDVKEAALATIGKEYTGKEITSEWKRKILRSEHSPIRALGFVFEWTDLPYWVSVHLSRHKIGVEHFVRTQRSDRTGVDRDQLPQGAPVTHRIAINAQAIMTISRKRLCCQASLSTQEAWHALLGLLHEVEPELAELCVPECVYRGFCPEFKPCGYVDSAIYSRAEYTTT